MILNPEKVTSLTNAAPGWFVSSGDELFPVELWAAITLLDSNCNEYAVMAAVITSDEGCLLFVSGEYVHDSYEGFAESYLSKLKPLTGDASWMSQERVDRYKQMAEEEERLKAWNGDR